MLGKRTHVAFLFLFCVFPRQGHTDLIGEWRFDGNARDSRGKNHGTLVGKPTRTANRYGDPGKALQLDGIDDYVDCGNDASLSFGNGTTDRPFSVEWWQKSNIVPALFKGKGFAVLGKRGEYFINWSNAFRIHLVDGHGSIGRAGGVSIKQHQWTHVVVTYDGSGSSGGIRFYQDGAFAGSDQEDSGAYTAMRNTNHPLRIGMRSPQITLDGLIDDVRIYDHVLSAGEVKALYNIHFGGIEITSRLPVEGMRAPEAPAQSGDALKTLKEIGINRTPTAPAVDGDLSDNAWRQVQWHSHFCVLGHPERTSKPKTSFAVLHDGANLYVAVRADEPTPSKMKALVTERDGRVSTDDCIGILLDSNGKGVCHYQFVVNSRGVLRDSQVARGGLFRKPEWNSDAKAATKLGSDAWFLELSIPFHCLSFHPGSPAVWRLNVARTRFVTGKKEVFTHAPAPRTPHDTRSFVLAQIEDVDLTPFLYDLSLETMRCSLQRGQIIGEAKLLVQNKSPLPRKVELVASLNAAGKKVHGVLRGLTLPHGVHPQDIALRGITIPDPASGEETLTVSLRDVALQRVVCRHRFPVVLDYTPLKVRVLRPHYQNAIFADQQTDVELQVTTALDSKERQEYLFEFLLRLDKEVLFRRSTKIEAEKTIVSVPMRARKLGDYRMEGRLVHKPSDSVIAEWRDVVRKLGPRKGEVRFDENWGCLIDNKPFLPFGLFNDSYSSPTRGLEAIRQSVELGCNAMSCDYCKWRECLDELHQTGLKIVVVPHARGVPHACWKSKGLDRPLTAEQEESLRSSVRETRGFSPLLCWYIGNEPQLPEVSPETMKQIDSIIREEDPYHPTVIINCAIRGIGPYVNAMALVMPDPYPSFLKNAGWQTPDYTTRLVEEAVRCSRGRKPVWALLQGSDFSHFGRSNNRAPSFVDLRNQMYQAAIAGAKGFFWYCRPWIEHSVEIGLSYLAKEAQLLRRAILAPESSHRFIAVTGADERGNVHLSSRQVGKDTYFLVVNGSDNEKNIAFKLNGMGDHRLFAVAERREVGVESGEFADSFKPYDTHIYTTDKTTAECLNIADVYKELEANCTAIPKPGNVAHRDCGTVVESSWVARGGKIRWSPPLDFVIDGIKGTSSWGDSKPKELSWVEMTFPKRERISKVIIDSNIRHLQLEVAKDGTWRKVADVRAGRDDRREVRTMRFPLEETEKLRVQSLAVEGEAMGAERMQTRIWEIEAYGED